MAACQLHGHAASTRARRGLRFCNLRILTRCNLGVNEKSGNRKGWNETGKIGPQVSPSHPRPLVHLSANPPLVTGWKERRKKIFGIHLTRPMSFPGLARAAPRPGPPGFRECVFPQATALLSATVNRHLVARSYLHSQDLNFLRFPHVVTLAVKEPL
jgi:hypothetical protein